MEDGVKHTVQSGTLSQQDPSEGKAKYRRASTSINEYIDFAKMPKRDFFLDRVQGAHESRFETKKHLVKLKKKVAVPLFKHQTDRPSFTDEVKVVKVLDGPPRQSFGFPTESSKPESQKVLVLSQAQYEPNFEAVKPSLRLSVPRFEKMKERDSKFLELATHGGPECYSPELVEQGFKHTLKKK